jgi:methyl-accepting chemotaxis protein
MLGSEGGMSGAGQADAGRLARRLAAFLEAYPEYRGVAVFDGRGRVLLGLDRDGTRVGPEVVIADRPAVARVLERGPGGRPAVSGRVQPSMTGSGRVFSVAAPATREAGGVCVEVGIDVLGATLVEEPDPTEALYPYLLDSQGTVIAHPDPELVLTDLSDADFVPGLLDRESGLQEYEFQGAEKVQVFTTLAGTGWKLMVTTRKDVLQEEALRQRAILVVLGAVTILALTGLIFLSLRRLVLTPIQRLEDFAFQIARGNLKAELVGEFHHEFGKLAEYMRGMVAELKQKLGFSQGILHGMTNALIVSDKDEKVIYCNQPILDFREHEGEPDDHLGKTVGEMMFDDPDHWTVTGQAFNDKKPYVGQIKTHTKQTNRTVHAQVNAAPLYDLDGNLLAGFAVFTDLTEMKEQQAKIEDQNAKIARIAGEANTVSEQVSSASEQLSAQVDQSSQGSEIQKNRTSEAVTAMEEMNASVLEVAKNANHASSLAEKTKLKAQEGAEIVHSVVNTINEVYGQAEELRQDMGELEELAEGIGRVMGMISDIADQTNLLALNAAIEAARAGEAGKGFAVVADEVRKLAEKTMDATRQVGTAIGNIRDSVAKNIENTQVAAEAITRSTEMAGSSGQALEAIVSMVEETADQVRSIATAADQQSAASEEINRSMEEIHTIASETAEAMVQSARAVSELAELSLALKQTIDEMQRQ